MGLTPSRDTSYATQVRSAPSPKAALAVIALALDDLAARITKLEAGDDWDSWGSGEDPAEVPDADILERMAQSAAEFSSRVNADSLTVEIKPPTPEKMEQRRMLERQQLKLALVTGDDSEDWTELYAKGGPLWLYAARRDLVLSYPEPVRRAMVQDVTEDDPQTAHEMGRDILKQPAGEPDLENGSGALAVGFVSGQKR